MYDSLGEVGVRSRVLQVRRERRRLDSNRKHEVVPGSVQFSRSFIRPFRFVTLFGWSLFQVGHPFRVGDNSSLAT
jgi:hypothetical protein